MNRRDFIKGIIAAGVAAGVPLGRAEALADVFSTAALKVPGRITGSGMDAVGGGWNRVWVTFIAEEGHLEKCAVTRKEPSVVVDFGKPGLYINSEAGDEFALNMPMIIEQGEEYTYSMILKRGEDAECVQLECGEQPTSYIPTLGQRR